MCHLTHSFHVYVVASVTSQGACRAIPGVTAQKSRIQSKKLDQVKDLDDRLQVRNREAHSAESELNPVWHTHAN